MECSQCVKSSHPSVPSPDGTLIASVLAPRLIIRSSESLEIVRTINLPPDFASRPLLTRWSPLSDDQSTGEHRLRPRILLADDDTVRVWDLQDSDWTAIINNAAGGFTKVAHVSFGSSAGSILTFSEFNFKVTAWLLDTGRSVEIRDPKFTTGKGYSYRPGSGHFALLTRPAAHDIITLHAPGDYKLLNSFPLATIDAQKVKWSPCGRWLAVLESAGCGFRVVVYTANGHLYRTYAGENENGVEGLGAKSFEWSPRGDLLAVGNYSNRVTLLRSTTFSASVFLDHTPTIKLPLITIWQEYISALNEHSFTAAAQPTCPPTVSSLPTDPNPKMGISTIAFNNPDGGYVATRDDSMPTTVWIWTLKQCPRPFSILVLHSPVRSLQWHPSRPDLLMIQTVHDERIVYVWSAGCEQPRIIKFPMENEKVIGKHEVSWLRREGNTNEHKAVIMSADSQHYVLGTLDCPQAQAAATATATITEDPDPRRNTSDDDKTSNNTAASHVHETALFHTLAEDNNTRLKDNSEEEEELHRFSPAFTTTNTTSPPSPSPAPSLPHSSASSSYDQEESTDDDTFYHRPLHRQHQTHMTTTT
ncbi:MAG: hypothetical protein M1819_006237 [Sarea resinae]|nr:MAG: hypothetical protein M1819_006237 [Sarea resinae]